MREDMLGSGQTAVGTFSVSVSLVPDRWQLLLSRCPLTEESLCQTCAKCFTVLSDF